MSAKHESAGRELISLLAVVATALLAGCSSVASDAPSTPLTTEAPSLLPYVDCMQERGWDLQYDEAEEGFSASEPPLGQEAQYREDEEYCAENFWPPDSRAFTAEEWNIIYAALIEQRDCFIAEGAEFADDPPFRNGVR